LRGKCHALGTVQSILFPLFTNASPSGRTLLPFVRAFRTAGERHMSKFAHLEAACGGSINPETLERFAKAMREYEAFMADLGALLGPVKS